MSGALSGPVSGAEAGGAADRGRGLLRRTLRRSLRWAVRWPVLAVCVLAWEAATRRAGNPYFPPPSAILPRMRQLWLGGPAGRLWLSEDAVHGLLPGIARMLAGFAIAAAAGVVLGVAVGRTRVVREAIEPVLRFFRAIPTPMLVPVFLVLFRIGTQMELATILFGAVWPVLLNTADGVAGVDPRHLETAAAFRFGPATLLWRVVLPSALPRILAGLRLAMALSLILMVFAEMVGSTGGVGYELVNAQSQFDLVGMWAVIVLLGVLGYLLNAVLVLAGRLLLGRRETPGEAEA